MKKNTGSCKGDYGCPSMPKSDVAKATSMGSEVDPLITSDFERVRVLQELELKIPTEAEIKLPSYAQEIKDIRKNIHLTQCKAVQEAFNPDGQITLFVEGYVHKNIQYTESNNGYLRDYSVNVPFKSYQRIDLENNISIPEGSSKNRSNIFELRELAKNGKEADRCNFGSHTYEWYNEPIHCKLFYSSVDQWDIAHNFDNWGRFNKLAEKMTVTLRLALTQKQFYSNNGAMPSIGTEPQTAVEKIQSLADQKQEEE